MDKSFDIHEELIKLSQGAIELMHELDVTSLSTEEINDRLDELVELLSNDPSHLADEVTFDSLRSFIKYFDGLRGKQKSKVLIVLITGLRSQYTAVNDAIESPHTYEDVIDMRRILALYMFLLQWTLAVAESQTTALSAPKKKPTKSAATTGKKGKSAAAPRLDEEEDTFDWIDQKRACLSLMKDLLHLNLHRLFDIKHERDLFVSLFTKPSYTLLSHPDVLRDDLIKADLFDILALCIQHDDPSTAAATSLVQNLRYTEHLAEPLADFLSLLADRYDHTQVTHDILLDLAKVRFTADTPWSKSCAAFLIRLAEKQARLVSLKLSLLVRHLDSDAYTLRCALIEVLGHVIANYLATAEAPADPAARRQSDTAFDRLEERCRDTNSFVRAKVLQTLGYLCELKVIPLRRRAVLLDAAIDRLRDKSAHVRKKAIQVLTTFLRTHPFSKDGGELRLAFFQEKVAATQTLLAQVPDTNPSDPTVLPAVTLLVEARYYADALHFVEQLHRAMERLLPLLSSRARTDVLEAVSFFVTAYHYRLAPAQRALRAMVHLVWRRDEAPDESRTLREHLLSAYQDVYFTPSVGLQDPLQDMTRHLLQWALESSVEALVSLEEVIDGLARRPRVFPDALRQRLWAIYGSSTARPHPVAHRRAAIMILGMMARAQPDLLPPHLGVLLRTLQALPQGSAEDLGGLCKYTCLALQRLPLAAPLVSDHPVLQTLCGWLVSDTYLTLGHTWFGVAEQAIQAVYVLAAHPDAVLGEAVRTRTASLHGEDRVSSVALATLLFIVGHVAVKQIVHLESLEKRYKRQQVIHPVEGSPTKKQKKQPSVVAESDPEVEEEEDISAVEMLEKDMEQMVIDHHPLQETSEEEDVYDQMGMTPMKKNNNKNNTRKRASPVKKRVSQPAVITDDLSRVTGNAEEEFSEGVAFVREKELLYGSESLLAVFAPVLLQICHSRSLLYAHPLLSASATLALSKFMCVSAAFCEAQLPLLLTLLMQSPQATLRNNVLIALGDLAVSFNHLMDQNIGYLYQGLRDADLSVRRNTLLVLTHLILNGMVKVKGQISEMAKCLVDSDARIKGLAQVFFTELAQKDPATIYNLLPDIVSHLSMSGTSTVALSEEDFCAIMRHLMQYIRKERQSENLVDKLCGRFRTTDQERQWRDIAFCLSQLPYGSEKSVRKLLEHFPSYQDKLVDDGVYGHFETLLGRIKKFMRVDMKPTVEELERRLKETRLESKEGEGKEEEEEMESMAMDDENKENENMSENMDERKDSVKDEMVESFVKEEEDGGSTLSKRQSRARASKKGIVS